MKKLQLKLKTKTDRSYPIWIGTGHYLKTLHDEIAVRDPSRVAVITDSNLNAVYRKDLENSLKDFAPVFLTFPAGEKNKNLRTVEKLFTGLVKARFDRGSLLVAFGGGVTGDMAGFLASIYMRGIPFIQVPTSLLAMVDSSIGGKTGVDTPEAKNMIGSFYQPASVIIDTAFLKSIPLAEFRNGLAEVIKHAVIRDRNSFHLLESRPTDIIAMDHPLLMEGLIYRNCSVKKNIVEKDEKEAGLRQILNFGHTAGHAIEQASGFRIPHGYAIAMGMAVESWFSFSKGCLEEKELHRIVRILETYGLLRYKKEFTRINTGKIVSAALSDKKNVRKTIRTVMISNIGKTCETDGKHSYDLSVGDLRKGLDFLKSILDHSLVTSTAQ
jgi:3-dehydroquinate synthase